MAHDNDFVDQGEEPEAQRTQEVGPTFDDVLKHSLVPLADGQVAISLSRMQDLEGRYGYNGGVGCDVAEGPCSCGAWHDKSDNKQLNPNWKPPSGE